MQDRYGHGGTQGVVPVVRGVAGDRERLRAGGGQLDRRGNQRRLRRGSGAGQGRGTVRHLGAEPHDQRNVLLVALGWRGFHQLAQEVHGSHGAHAAQHAQRGFSGSRFARRRGWRGRHGDGGNEARLHAGKVRARRCRIANAGFAWPGRCEAACARPGSGFGTLCLQAPAFKTIQQPGGVGFGRAPGPPAATGSAPVPTLVS